MAVTSAPDESRVIASTVSRTYLATIETPNGGTYSIKVYREALDKNADGDVVKTRRPNAPIYRLASAVAGESVTLADDTVITAAQIYEALPLFFDRWEEEEAA